MYIELPEFKRCCLCLPLRRGILAFAYLNIILIILQISVLYSNNVDDLNVMPLRSVDFEMPVILSTVLCLLELVANILLICGAHMKRLLCIQIFYYFTMTMLVATLISEIISTIRSGNDDTFIIYFIFCLIINLYLLFLVRSLILKIQVSDNNKFNNLMAQFVDTPVRNGDVYPEIVVPREKETE